MKSMDRLYVAPYFSCSPEHSDRVRMKGVHKVDGLLHILQEWKKQSIDCYRAYQCIHECQSMLTFSQLSFWFSL